VCKYASVQDGVTCVCIFVFLQSLIVAHFIHQNRHERLPRSKIIGVNLQWPANFFELLLIHFSLFGDVILSFLEVFRLIEV